MFFILSCVSVGPNGSGKSSLLAGMRFVMGESTATDRERYLHHGASSKVYYGYVSAIFDNSDGRIPGVRENRLRSLESILVIPYSLMELG